MTDHRFRTAPPPDHDPTRYGWAHQKARNAAKYRHRDTDPCARCHQPLGPMGRWLHYDHAEDGITYLGFSHGTCNKSAGARKGNQRQRAKRGRGTPSRDWYGTSTRRELPRW